MTSGSASLPFQAMSQTVRPELVGRHTFSSPMFSNIWTLSGPHGEVAQVRRFPSVHVSVVTFTDGEQLQLQPEGWGTVVAEGDYEDARIYRETWWGGTWVVSGKGFEYELTSDHLPRKWTLRIGGHPVGRISGSLLSYNHIDVEADFALPVHAVLLSWHVLARPWEATATPRTLIPHRPDDADDT